MSNLGLFKLVTTPDGTVVKEVDSRGTQTGRQLWSFKWDSRDQNQLNGVPKVDLSYRRRRYDRRREGRR